METRWQFPTDTELDAYCREIAGELVARFGISEEEAVGRINRDWRPRHCLGPHVYLVYHETPEYWATEIYYGKDSYWWIAPEKREHLGLGPVEPAPYP